MGSLAEPLSPPFVEKSHMPDIWIDGIQRIEPLAGGCFRIICYTNRTDEDHRVYRQAAVALIASGEAIAAKARMLLAAVTAKPQKFL